MDKNKEEFEHDWYGILGCETGSSKEAIEKAARKLSVKYHPDKTTDPEAPAKFLLIQKAKEILSDETKKKVIDDYYTSQKVRKEYEATRNKNIDETRKRFRENLEKKVQSEIDKSKLDPNEVLRRELKKKSKVMEQMKKKNEIFMEKFSEEESRKAFEKQTKSFEEYNKFMDKENGINLKQIKIKWKRTSLSHSEESLYQLFKTFGTIEEIVLSKTKGTSALVTFSDENAANKAIDSFATSDEFRVYLVTSEKSADRPSIFTYKFSNNESINSSLQSELERLTEINKTKQTLSQIFFPFYQDNSSQNLSFETYLQKEATILDF